MKKVITFGEIMGRLSPAGYGRITQAQSLNITYGGGEANVSGGLAHIGISNFTLSKTQVSNLLPSIKLWMLFLCDINN